MSQHSPFTELTTGVCSKIKRQGSCSVACPKTLNTFLCSTCLWSNTLSNDHTGVMCSGNFFHYRLDSIMLKKKERKFVTTGSIIHILSGRHLKNRKYRKMQRINQLWYELCVVCKTVFVYRMVWKRFDNK